jgi:lysophospholipase L1-like esterase
MTTFVWRFFGVSALCLSAIACSSEGTGAAPTGAAAGSAGYGNADAGAGGSAGTDPGSGGEAGSGSAEDASGDSGEPADAGTLDAAVHESAAGDAGASDASIPYNPCPPKGAPCRAMPMGDSITRRYRPELYRQILLHEQAVVFVGSVDAGPATTSDGVPVPHEFEGHSGYTIPRIQTWIQDHDVIRTYKPDIVMLEAGTNGPIRSTSETGAATELRDLGSLVDYILGVDSHLLLIVAQITPLTDDLYNSHVQMFNAGIPALVRMRAATGKHIGILDAYTPFVSNPNWKTELMSSDGVHPTDDKGFPLLGRTWYTVVGPLLR